MKIHNTSSRLHYLMSTRNLRQIDILNACIPYCQQNNVKMNKSDISQYVSGKVEPNQDKLYILGKALGVSEAWLMGYDVPMERISISNNETVAPKIIDAYKKLNMLGKQEAEKRMQELTFIPKYTTPEQTLQAAHERTDIEVTDEMRKHDDDIMNDENF